MTERVPNTVYVLGLDYEVKAEVHWHDAVTSVLQGKMTPFKVHESKRLRSAGGSVDMAWPLIVRLNYWVTVPQKKEEDPDSYASRHEILKRDGWTCAYCGDKVSAGKQLVVEALEDSTGRVVEVVKNLNPTIDHVLPASRGGKNTWANLVACCVSCNSKKADRTPEEAGMTLLWTPHAKGDKARYRSVQKEVWRILEEGGGFVEEALHYEGLIS